MMSRITEVLPAAALTFAMLATSAFAADFQYRRSVTLNIGQSTILKGVRHQDCGDTAPTWGHIRPRLPKPKTGKLSNGGAGTVVSESCGGRVGARGVKFTATKAGKETLTIYDDKVTITVN